jgi:hypothetical protein
MRQRRTPCARRGRVDSECRCAELGAACTWPCAVFARGHAPLCQEIVCWHGRQDRTGSLQHRYSSATRVCSRRPTDIGHYPSTIKIYLILHFYYQERGRGLYHACSSKPCDSTVRSNRRVPRSRFARHIKLTYALVGVRKLGFSVWVELLEMPAKSSRSFIRLMTAECVGCRVVGVTSTII